LGRDLEVEADAIDVEVVNILHCGTPDFLVCDSLGVEALLLHRARLVKLAQEMALTQAVEDAGQVPASPSGLCRDWCPFLHRCSVGQAHVRKYQGEGAVEVRLVDLP
jgi:hypothetical protein